jgi:hypothetical protein
MLERAKTIIFGALRRSGVRGVLAYCKACGLTRDILDRSSVFNGDVRLSDIESQLV